jgi:hypothetical protein
VFRLSCSKHGRDCLHSDVCGWARVRWGSPADRGRSDLPVGAAANRDPVHPPSSPGLVPGFPQGLSGQPLTAATSCRDRRARSRIESQRLSRNRNCRLETRTGDVQCFTTCFTVADLLAGIPRRFQVATLALTSLAGHCDMNCSRNAECCRLSHIRHCPVSL